MRADRLMSILFELQTGSTVTVRDLAERLEVSTRTVTRDMESLAAAGVPVYSERGYGGGWRLTEGFRARFNGLKRDDLERLLLSRSGSARLFGDLGKTKEYEETWERLFAAASQGMPNIGEAVLGRLHVDGGGWLESFEVNPHLPTLYDAIWDSEIVLARYGRDDAPDWRIAPLGLVAKGSTWYVLAQGEDGELRTYRVSRFQSILPTGETFKRPLNFNLAEAWAEVMSSFREAVPTYEVTVIARYEAIERLRSNRFVQIRKMEPLEDELVRANVDFQTEEHAVRCLLATGGPDVRIETPENLKFALRAAVRRLATAYD